VKIRTIPKKIVTFVKTSAFPPMKTIIRILLPILLAAGAAGCDAFNALTRSDASTAQGRPYELIVVCDQPKWTGAVGDSLRAVFTAPVPYLNQTEPLFDVIRVTEQGFTKLIVQHRNILKVVTDPALAETTAAVQYDVEAQPQIVLTLQGPDDVSLLAYIDAHRSELVQILEKAERDRSIRNNEAFNAPNVSGAVRKLFDVDMKAPAGYIVAKEEPDFLWARYEYPKASQGFFVYSYPYEGPESLSPGALLAARNKFAARIPGPSDGSYMTTSDAFEPDYRMFRLEGRLWIELRGFWDVKGDFMGGPFVSYTTVDTRTGRVFTFDGYVYAPDLNKPRKRNYIRGIEHLLYSIRFPQPEETK